MKTKKHFLALADGEVFYGDSCGASADSFGEAVFNTGMTGYQEIATDPSYFGQIVALTTPEVGNYGVNHEDNESDGIHLGGMIFRKINQPSNYRSEGSFDAFLKSAGKPALTGVDIRRLVLHLRKAGTQKAYLHCTEDDFSENEAIQKAQNWSGLDGIDSVSEVSCRFFHPYPGSITDAPKVVVFDYGVKFSILRSLTAAGINVEILPAAAKARDALARKPNGILFSNGPGDPVGVKYAIETAHELIGSVPLMGICLGHQILALAAGAETERLAFGHHGCNHPVKCLINGSVAITSQNHNFAVRLETLPKTLELSHVNLNDGTVEGIRHRTEPVFSVQFHPEAAPGPHDAKSLFQQFRQMF
ncbi:MAG: glutamine-hydrolyzing carbamoyl-phosphate synthase small subunit [Planctomycetia bacterium]|nr:glutamine-hydrolyzing carbamoyl-phosphate synthase small subunit [Planctomycetia bacterium]